MGDIITIFKNIIKLIKNIFKKPPNYIDYTDFNGRRLIIKKDDGKKYTKKD